MFRRGGHHVLSARGLKRSGKVSPSWPGRALPLESDPLDAESIGPISEAMLQVLKVGHEVRHGRVAEVLFLLKAHRDNML